MEPFENLPEFEPKKARDIKIALSDLYSIFEQIYNLASEHVIPEEDYANISLLFNKYIVLSKFRDEETLWYDIAKKLDSSADEIIKGNADEKRRIAFEYYIKAKHNRELLQKELQRTF